MSIEVAPNWYLYSVHLSAIVTTPINFLGLFVILFCKTNQLGSLRWHLFIFQICSMSTDFLVAIGTLPVLFTPFPIGRPHGIFTWIFQLFGLESSSAIQAVIVFVSMYFTAGSVELLFLLRYQNILPQHHSYKLSKLTLLVLFLIYQILHVSLMLICFFLSCPDQTIARAQFARLHPELQYLITDEHVYILCVVVEAIHVMFLSLCFLRLTTGFLTVILLIWMSSRALHSFQLSTRTRKMHFQLIRNLSYQISVPVLAFYGPLFVMVIPLIFSIPNSQFYFFIAIIFLSFHTFLGTLSMFYFNRPYREGISSLLRHRTFKKTLESSRITNLNIVVVF